MFSIKNIDFNIASTINDNVKLCTYEYSRQLFNKGLFSFSTDNYTTAYSLITFSRLLTSHRQDQTRSLSQGQAIPTLLGDLEGKLPASLVS